MDPILRRCPAAWRASLKGMSVQDIWLHKLREDYQEYLISLQLSVLTVWPGSEKSNTAAELIATDDERAEK